MAFLRCFCSLELVATNRLVGCVALSIGEGMWEKFPVMDFERSAGRFRRHWLYMGVPTPSGLFEVPTSLPVEHSGWSQGELAGAVMASLWGTVKRLRSAELCAFAIVCEFVA